VNIPVYVDGDTGFGGVHNVHEIVRAFGAAGVAGLFFSDQVVVPPFPRHSVSRARSDRGVQPNPP
jgi:2-methylisocitrate lyase-like PEP mutase family enzyme